ncbi:MAG: hypothetical protein WDW36_003183 [Sanguina aurantia]
MSHEFGVHKQSTCWADGDITLRIESGADNVVSSRWPSILYVAASWDPYELVDRGVIAAAALSGGARPRLEKTIPASLDLFGWCTWDAFYSTVSARGLHEGLDSLAAGGIPPRFLIIDDGWQSTDVDVAYRKAPTTELAEEMSDAMQLGREGSEIFASQEEGYYQESLEVIAKTGKMMPPSQTDRVMQTLLAKGPSSRHGAHPPKAEPAVSKPVENTSLQLPQQGQLQSLGDGTYLAGLGQRIAGYIVGLGTAAFLIFYQSLIEPAPPGSLRVRCFAAAAQGFLRPAMLSFFAAASDFTRRLTSVRANSKFSSPDAGPDEEWGGKEERLGDVVAQLKAQYGLQFVYCWHGLPAYWAGVMPDMEGHPGTVLYASPTPGVLEVEPSMAWNPAVLAGIGVVNNPDKLYNAMHKYLADSGVDGVKVDCQAGVGLIGSASDGGAAMSKRFHMALEGSVAEHFPGNHAINCMCHSTENMYRMQDTVVARASDDFYPRDPASSHPHIAACSYNTLFMSPLLQPDWDMFHSKHPSARIHAMARAISGAAVYVSDKPGEHDLELLRQLVLPDGSVMRCRGVARPTRDCLFLDVLRDNKSLLKVWNVNAVTAVVGIFHLQGSSWDRTRRKFYTHDKEPARLKAEVRPTDIETFRGLDPPAARDDPPTSSTASSSRAAPTPPTSATAPPPAAGAPAGARSGDGSGGVGGAARFVAFSHTTQRLVALAPNQAMPVSLSSGEGDVVTVSPIVHRSGVSFAPVGLMAMMNGGAAILSCVSDPDPESAPQADLKASGRRQQQDSQGTSALQYSAASGVSGASGASGMIRFLLDVRGCGELLLYSSVAPSQVLVNNGAQQCSFDASTGRLLLNVPQVQSLLTTVVVQFPTSAQR